MAQQQQQQDQQVQYRTVAELVEAGLESSKNPEFFVVDLRDFPLPERNEILKRFYDGLILTNFPFPDELDPPEIWERMFTPGDEMYDFTIMHILLAFDRSDRELKNILGGNVLEYYPRSQYSLLSFIVVDIAARQRKLGSSCVVVLLFCSDLMSMETLYTGKYLVDVGYDLMNQEAKTRNGLEQCRAYVAETNQPELVSAEEDSMAPTLRVEVLQRMGFQVSLLS